MAKVFDQERPERVVHLAAQAGVRHAFSHPHDYIDANITGFMNILEGCRYSKVEHLVFASTSAVYGANTALPFSVHQSTDHPVSLYGATKKANELMAHSYAHLFGLPVTGLRFFTVYGPWGRPDMSLFLFTKKILADEAIDIFNNGNHSRDFTYIDDIVEGVVRVLDTIPQKDLTWDSDEPDPARSSAPYRLFNIGNNQPVELMHFIACIEKALGKTAVKRMLPLQLGDVHRTYANVDDLAQAVGFRPSTSIEQGIDNFVRWYRQYYGVS
jgi:UDP-glucuronate 4-epimerase